MFRGYESDSQVQTQNDTLVAPEIAVYNISRTRNIAPLPADTGCACLFVKHMKQDFAQRRSQSAPLSITYGSTELVNAEGFFEQLMELGTKQA